METNNTSKLAQYTIRATEYLKKYGPDGTFTSINAPYGKVETIVNYNPFFGVYGKSEEAQKGYALALETYKAKKRTDRAGVSYRF